MTATAAPVPGIAGHQLLVFLLQFGGLLGLAVLLGGLVTRFGLPAVVGELAAGLLAGPSLLGHLLPRLSGWLLPADPAQVHLLDVAGQLGVLLLVGIAGIQLDVGLLHRQRRSIAVIGGGALLVPLALGVGGGVLLPGQFRVTGSDRGVFALFMGVALCVSAIPVIASTLLQLDLFDREIGQLIMGAAAVDDALGWLLLALVSATSATGLAAGEVVRPVCCLIAVVVVAAAPGRPMARVVLRLAARSGTPGAAVATVVVLLVLAAAGTEALGMEPILGALLGGMVIGSAGLADPRVLTPLRTIVLAVLAPVFFATAGLRMDLNLLRQPVVLGCALAMLLVAVVGKFAGAYLGAKTCRHDHWTAIALGAGLNARGVIEVVVAMVGLRLGVLSTASYTVIVLIAVVTSLMAPPLLRCAVARMPGRRPGSGPGPSLSRPALKFPGEPR